VAKIRPAAPLPVRRSVLNAPAPLFFYQKINFAVQKLYYIPGLLVKHKEAAGGVFYEAVRGDQGGMAVLL
jgi:hypothetical protein